MLTKGGDVLLASEAGVLGIREADIEVKGRLQPGKLLMADLAAGRLHANREAERRVAAQRPYGRWYRENVVRLEDLPERPPRVPRTEPLRARQLAFGFTQEDLRVLLGPDGPRRRRADRLDGQRRRARGALRPPAAAIR